MTGHSGSGTRATLLLFLIVAAALLVVGISKTMLVLEVGSPSVIVPVSKGDVFVRTYMHSMYHVPVSEKFRIEDKYFRLVHVMTQSDAVLAYLGVEGKDEPNVDRQLREFTIPAASMGNHVIQVHDRNIPLGTHEDRGGKIHVKLIRMPLLVHFARLVWR
jgi:hypothetical protein